MYYKAELDYLIRVLRKMQLSVRLIDPNAGGTPGCDLGLRRILGLSEDMGFLFRSGHGKLRENTIYRISDSFRCNYLFLLLPEHGETCGLIIGPYTAAEISRSEMLELSERFELSAAQIPLLQDCFSSIPVLRDQSHVLNLLSCFGETIWGGGHAFDIVDIERLQPNIHSLRESRSQSDSNENINYRMKSLEARYAYENELMDMVAQGRHHRAELMLSGFSGFNFESRAADPLRNAKNYFIVFNTLMRKAAERGGVHPVYLDSISSDYAKKIELLSRPEEGLTLMPDMLRAYCRLVRRHAEANFSSPVRSVLACIESDLSADLSLRALAESHNISAGYLSTLFRKDTGKTLTEYVNEQRMEEAARLLDGTRLQVQTVAQHCGISDVNYFSKLFKKYYGLTPKKFREEAALKKST